MFPKPFSGITFEQLSSLDKTQPVRVVEITLPPGIDSLIRLLPGMEDYDAGSECLSLLKPGFGPQGCPTSLEPSHWSSSWKSRFKTDQHRSPVICEAQTWKMGAFALNSCR